MRQTSTDTDSTGSAIGGSGFVAFTHTSEASKSASIRSAIAVQSASSVLYERCWATSATISQTRP